MKQFHRAAAGILALGVVLGNAAALPARAAGGIVINEVCTKNTQSPAPDGGLYDYVELYNAGSAAVDLGGYGLTDKAEEPFRYTIPAGTSLAPGARLVIWCDKNGTGTAPFGLSTSGETLTLTSPDGATADTLTVGALAADTAYGQYPDGSGDWFVLSCTPGAANAAPQGSDAVHAPTFSHESGFYDAAFQLTLTVPDGTEVYYTTDGSDPTTQSERYTGAISVQDMSQTPNRLSARTDIAPSNVEAPNGNVDKAAVIRAAAFAPDGTRSDIVTNTYFLGKTNSGYYKSMKVISLVTDPENLFNYETGIYCLGKVYDEEEGGGTSPGWGGWGGWPGFGGKNPWEMAANYTQKGREWERPAVFTLFDNGTPVLSQDVGIRIKGAASRSSVQKSFNVYARADYGKDSLEYDFFGGEATKAKNGKVIDKFDSIVIRNGGNDNGYAVFRDSIDQALVEDRAFAWQAMDECVVFLDGEFWGIYQITEKVGKDYIKDHYDVAKDDVAMIKNSELEEGTDQDLADWEDLMTQVGSGAMSYADFCEKVDKQSFLDYFAVQIYWSNWDWPQNNTAVWRSNTVDASNPYADGKWRMFLFDTEYGTGLYGSETTSVQSDPFSRISRNTDDFSRMFTTLCRDETFRKDFARTMMDLANYNFTTDKTEDVIAYYRDSYKQQILDTFTRFYSKSLSGGLGEQRFSEEYRTISDFYKGRGDVICRVMRNALNVSDRLLNVSVTHDTAKGTVKLNTLTLGDEDASFTGRYHTDYDLDLTAQAKDGASFSHWEIAGATLPAGSLTDPTISVHLDGDAKITPVYGDALVGDYDANGVVDVRDVVLLTRWIHGEKVTLAKTDVVADGVTDTFDLAMLKRIVTKK